MSYPEEKTWPHVATFPGKIKTKAKAVGAIDIGTTFSGASYVYKKNPKVVNCGAPGISASRDAVKVPTVLLEYPDGWLFGQEALDTYHELVDEYSDENSDGVDTDEVVSKKGIHLYRFYKMKLKGQVSGVETLEAKSTSGKPHQLMDLMVRTLKALSDFVKKEIHSGYGAALDITNDDILWVVTVPAIWNNFSKVFMRKAAFKAGIITDEASDKLLLALEPECASLAIHQEGSRMGLYQGRGIFMVLDCGGGTIDITLHTVASTNPLVLDEASLPAGGAWGGIFVDLEFERFLKKFLGEKMLQRLQNRFPVEVEEIKESFRLLKESFDGTGNSKRGNRVSFANILKEDIRKELGLSELTKLAEDYNLNTGSVAFDLNDKQLVKRMKRDSTLTFSDEQMRSFFKPTLDKICHCVKGILHQNPEVSAIVLVGGYGSSKVLEERIRSTFEVGPFNKKVIKPNGDVRPQAAIVHGASHFGLYSSVIGVTLAAKTYGVNISKKWYEGSRFAEEQARWDNGNEEKRVHDVFSRIVKQATRISPGESFKRSDYHPIYRDQKSVTFGIFESDQEDPTFTTDSGCEKLGSITVPCRNTDDNFDVHFTFGAELRVEVIRQDGDRHLTTIQID